MFQYFQNQLTFLHEIHCLFLLVLTFKLFLKCVQSHVSVSGAVLWIKNLRLTRPPRCIYWHEMATTLIRGQVAHLSLSSCQHKRPGVPSATWSCDRLHQLPSNPFRDDCFHTQLPKRTFEKCKITPGVWLSRLLLGSSATYPDVF